MDIINFQLPKHRYMRMIKISQKSTANVGDDLKKETFFKYLIAIPSHHLKRGCIVSHCP